MAEQKSPIRRLIDFLVPPRRAADWVPTLDRNCSVYVGLPFNAPQTWEKTRSYNKNTLTLQNGISLKTSDVTSYLVVYPNGEICRFGGVFLPFPEGVTDLKSSQASTESLQLNPAQLAAAQTICVVDIGQLRKQTDGKIIYRTSLRNLSDHPIRILKFAALGRQGDRFLLNTVSGSFYSAEQFAAWYATPPDHWIAPGQIVFDDCNYGSGNGIWAYFGVMAAGTAFIATVELPRP